MSPDRIAVDERWPVEAHHRKRVIEYAYELLNDDSRPIPERTSGAKLIMSADLSNTNRDRIESSAKNTQVNGRASVLAAALSSPGVAAGLAALTGRNVAVPDGTPVQGAVQGTLCSTPVQEDALDGHAPSEGRAKVDVDALLDMFG